MENLMYIILAGLIAFLVWIFGKKQQQEKTLNNSKIPANVRRWEPFVMQAANQFGVPAHIAMSVLWVESAGNPSARGSAGEKGLMQLKQIAVDDLYLKGYGKFPGWQTDPEQNIKAGVAFLDLQYSRTGNWYEAVKAYNQGYAGMQKHPELANQYLDKVRAKEKFFR